MQTKAKKNEQKKKEQKKKAKKNQSKKNTPKHKCSVLLQGSQEDTPNLQVQRPSTQLQKILQNLEVSKKKEEEQIHKQKKNNKYASTLPQNTCVQQATRASRVFHAKKN